MLEQREHDVAPVKGAGMTAAYMLMGAAVLIRAASRHSHDRSDALAERIPAAGLAVSGELDAASLMRAAMQPHITAVRQVAISLRESTGSLAPPD